MKVIVDKSLIEQALSGLLREPLGADHSAIRQKLRTALAEPAVEPNTYGWAIQHANGTSTHLRCRVVDFFGEIQEREPFTESDLRAADREWAGLAPHTMVTLFTSPPPAEVPLLSDEEIAEAIGATGYSAGAERYRTVARAIEQAVRQKAGL